jgi:hypothetical protein
MRFECAGEDAMNTMVAAAVMVLGGALAGCLDASADFETAYDDAPPEAAAVMVAYPVGSCGDCGSHRHHHDERPRHDHHHDAHAGGHHHHDGGGKSSGGGKSGGNGHKRSER